MQSYIKADCKRCIELVTTGQFPVEEVKYRNKYKKAIYFLFNEGLQLTLRKSKVIQLGKNIIKEQNIVICEFEINSNRCIGIGRQLYRAKHKKFHPKMVFQVKPDYCFELEDLILTDDLKLKIFNYLPVDESPFDDGISESILKLNSALVPLNSKLNENYIWQPVKYINENTKRVFLYGFGAYARVFVLPHFKNNLNSIIDYNQNVFLRYKHHSNISYFEDYRDSLVYYKKVSNPIAIISTYHSSHFEIAQELFNVNPTGKVFIEKPIVVRFKDALELIKLRRKGFWVEAGYNRRYIDWNIQIKNILQNMATPKIINISVKEHIIPTTHQWYFWKNQSTRITGNLSHWIDLAYYWLKCHPREATLLNSGDSICLAIKFEDGSLVNITASDVGSSLRGVQEKIEIRVGEKTIFIDDYKKMVIFDNDKTIIKRKLFRDKGHDNMYKTFLYRIKNNLPPVYEEDDIFWVSYLIERASKMFINGERNAKVEINY